MDGPQTRSQTLGRRRRHSDSKEHQPQPGPSSKRVNYDESNTPAVGDECIKSFTTKFHFFLYLFSATSARPANEPIQIVYNLSKNRRAHTFSIRPQINNQVFVSVCFISIDYRVTLVHDAGPKIVSIRRKNHTTMETYIKQQ